ncbi:DUF2971 domain-containing protein [Ectothiorhodospira variabilis]|uniref:DUF2971 domain-containing protein n=1 Tax=Ectothiorhodospira variabilis TaxID=505694 RepID=UPI001EFA53B8|nr:DUF2971 domain-containing protein [Ectothiorhodospira variabilis]MCG5495684.1 DUF2971 domain-containing protein [Ectothiorhodospira variabilis]MCG5496586.1 DUF2971 domain-containing protein [Ectothiorhodospira variabilis]MCG5504580.1 DUF2971 domain-containing protein [Ectothiorhodospira variabilis]MCG5507712.1 DUF2971 domain-containing protein [Ectothiorhodospira variabilis]
MTTTLTCFKYRSPAAALRCLAEGSLYFAKPSELNDTLEAKYEHATPEDFARVMTQTHGEISQQRGGPALIFEQRDIAEMAEVHARECQRLQAFTDQIGIFSAAQRPDHQAMWAYYADNASGVCFELEWSQEIVERHQLWATEVQYHGEARIHNRAEDWRQVFLELAREHPDVSLETLHQLSLDESARRKFGILSASRAASAKHNDWSHEKETRLLAPKSGALPVLGEALKRVYYVRTDGEHWRAIMQLLHAYYRTVETMHWQPGRGTAPKSDP